MYIIPNVLNSRLTTKKKKRIKSIHFYNTHLTSHYMIMNLPRILLSRVYQFNKCN